MLVLDHVDVSCDVMSRHVMVVLTVHMCVCTLFFLLVPGIHECRGIS